MSDLVRYVNRTAVLPIAAAFALAIVTVSFVIHVVLGFVLLPLRQGSIPGLSAFDLIGVASVHGRLISWIAPAEQILSLLVLATGAMMVLRARGETAADAECPWCRSPIPLAASVCRSCRREVAR